MSVVSILGAENKINKKAENMSNQEKVKKYEVLKQQFKNSRYSFEKKKLKVKSNTNKDNVNTLTNRERENKEVKIIKNVINEIIDKIEIKEKSKIVFLVEEKVYIIIFENKLKKGEMGTEYSAKVYVDKKTLKISKILSGG